jgi:transcriptional regulator with XRE-family HTH domain
MVHPLAEARKRANLSQAALAKLIGKDRLTILRIEKAQTQPPPETVAEIVKALRKKNVELSPAKLRPDLAKAFGDAA